MPTIEVNMKVLEKLAKQKVKEEDLEVVKGELEEIQGAKAKIEIGDTNRPDMWSVEGIARVLRGYYKKSNGLPKLNLKKSGKKIIVDKKLQNIRPFIGGFIARNVKVTEELLLDLIQLQEKLSENFGKKRKKISVGIYNNDLVKYPVYYKAVDPEKASFVPLELSEPLNLKTILKTHPKGQAYGHILKEQKLYPLFVDSKDDVLSFPPIINSNHLGKVQPGMDNLFIEITGDDIKAVLLAINIFAYALQDRGSRIETITIEYPWKTIYGSRIETPFMFNETMSFKKDNVKKLLGLDLKDNEIKNLLERMQYDVLIKRDLVTVTIPSYRNDIMHFADVIEDIGMCYGYSNMKDLEITSFTVGKVREHTLFYKKVKRIMVGTGFQEIMSAILSNKKHQSDNMLNEEPVVEIDNVMSENYSSVRNWVIPSLMSCLSKNMHVEYPQNIFEVDECVVLDDDSLDGTKTVTKIAAAICNIDIGYEIMSSYLDSLLSNLGLSFELQKTEHNSFISGRVAKIFIDNKEVGIIGEIHPQVLNNWGLEKAVVAFELDADVLFNLCKK